MTSAGFVEEAKQKIEKEVKLPSGYYMTWGGAFENQQRAMKRLAVIVPLTIAFILSSSSSPSTPSGMPFLFS